MLFLCPSFPAKSQPATLCGPLLKSHRKACQTLASSLVPMICLLEYDCACSGPCCSQVLALCQMRLPLRLTSSAYEADLPRERSSLCLWTPKMVHPDLFGPLKSEIGLNCPSRLVHSTFEAWPLTWRVEASSPKHREVSKGVRQKQQEWSSTATVTRASNRVK